MKKSMNIIKSKIYHYLECGLTNVYLENGFNIDKDENLYIENINSLHNAIGYHLINKSGKLSAREIRFIRHMMDLSQKALGMILGVKYLTILRWEKGELKINKSAEYLLRMYFLEFLRPESSGKDLIDRISDIDNDRHNQEPDIKLQYKKSSWEEKLAA